MSLVSVIIPVYNCERYLSEAIGSVLAQTYGAFEVIVVDDGSTDGSSEAARGFGSALQYYLQPRGGAGSARNRGAALARGDYLAFLDADDLWVRSKLALQMSVFRDDPGLDMVFGHVRQFHSPELDEKERKKIYCPADEMPGFVAGAMLIKKRSFERAGPFEVSWKTGEFIDWYSRSVECGLRSLMLPDVVLGRRLHTTNMGVRERGLRTDYLRILRASLGRRSASRKSKNDISDE